MRKVFRKLHLWLSVPFGIIITITCLSGAALVFETEIMELCYPKRYFVEQVGNKPLSVDELLAKVSQTLPDSVSITSVNISSDPRRAYQVGLSKPRRAGIFIDQYTGEVKERYERAGFFTFMLRLHRWLLDSMKPGGGMSVGKTVVGVSTLAFVFVLISGIVIWVPRTRKALKNRLKISLNKGLKRFWYDLHVAGGIYAAIILLALALTGLTWSFQWYRTGFYKVFGVEVQQQQQGAPPQGGQNQPQAQAVNAQNQIPQGGEERKGNRGESRERRNGENLADSLHNGRRERGEVRGRRGKGLIDSLQVDEKHDYMYENRRNETIPLISPFANWQQVYVRLAEANPAYKQINISKGSASVSFNRWGNQRASDRYVFEPESGKITESNLYKNSDKSGKLRGWIYSVHVGNWGGLFSKIITFLAALLGASLPITGYYLWIKKSINKRKNKTQAKVNK